MAQNYSTEATRYEQMLPNSAHTPVFTAPGTAPKPVHTAPDTAPKITTPGAERAATMPTHTVTIGSGESAPAPGMRDTAATPTLQELVTAYSAERDAILASAEKRHVLEWGNAALKDQQVWQYIQHSGGNPDLDGLAVLMDAALAEYRNPTRSAGMDYAKKTANQIVLGNATDDVTLAGTAGQLLLGFTGADFLTDVRDLSYDLTHLRTIPPGQLGLDALALLPVVGGLKYVDEAGALIKHGQNAAEAAGNAGKHGDDLVDAGGELVYNGAKQLENIELKPAELMEELAASGKKYTPEDVLMVTKNSNGDLLWLEKGHEKNGWKHIVDKHGEDFQHADGSYYSEDEIQMLMKQFLDSEPIHTGVNKNGPYAIYSHNGQNYRIGWGDNGYIKSFFPDEKKYQ